MQKICSKEIIRTATILFSFSDGINYVVLDLVLKSIMQIYKLLMNRENLFSSLLDVFVFFVTSSESFETKKAWRHYDTRTF